MIQIYWKLCTIYLLIHLLLAKFPSFSIFFYLIRKPTHTDTNFISEWKFDKHLYCYHRSLFIFLSFIMPFSPYTTKFPLPHLFNRWTAARHYNITTVCLLDYIDIKIEFSCHQCWRVNVMNFDCRNISAIQLFRVVQYVCFVSQMFIQNFMAPFDDASHPSWQPLIIFPYSPHSSVQMALLVNTPQQHV